MMKLLHVGAVPRCTFVCSTCGLNTVTTPIITSSACVARSVSARKMLSRADSWTPPMLSATSSPTTTAPPTMSHGCPIRFRLGSNLFR